MHDYILPGISKHVLVSDPLDSLDLNDRQFIVEIPIYEGIVLRELLLAAEYLEIRPLYELCIFRIASGLLYEKSSGIAGLIEKLGLEEDLEGNVRYRNQPIGKSPAK